jgi:hypothetical protein
VEEELEEEEREHMEVIVSGQVEEGTRLHEGDEMMI